MSREIDDSTVELREAIDARDYHAESVLVPWLTELRNERDRLQVRLAYLSHRTTAKPKGQSK